MNEEQVGQETSASIGLRLRGARSLDQMGLNVVHHLEGVEEFAFFAHQERQIFVDEDHSAVNWMLQLVVLDVLPHKAHEFGSGGPLLASDVRQEHVRLDELQDVLVSFVGAHDDLRWDQKFGGAKKSTSAFLDALRRNDSFPESGWRNDFYLKIN